MPLIWPEKFKKEDIEFSQIAKDSNIDNTIPEDQEIYWHTAVTNFLSPINDLLSLKKQHIIINSAFRSVELNKQIHGASTSQHLGKYHRNNKTAYCCAFDIETNNNHNKDLFIMLTNYMDKKIEVYNTATATTNAINRAQNAINILMRNYLYIDQLIWEYETIPNEPDWIHVGIVFAPLSPRGEIIKTRKNNNSLLLKRVNYGTVLNIILSLPLSEITLIANNT